ncbi:metallophosphoesterase [Candidatus Pacearchaeota archaeon]|nr:metallophosphoesterase [Candidatus Pacearchaeota archaeon]
MNLDLLGIIKERGLLLEKEIFEALSSINDIFTIRKLLDNFEQVSGQKMITRSNLIKNWVFSKKISEDLIEGIQPKFLKIFIQLGIQINVEDIPVNIKKVEESKLKPNYTVHYANTTCDKKVELKDFVGHFRARYKEIQNIILARTDLNNLISINKISSTRQQFSIIGMVSEKRYTKKRNLIVVFEDMTGKTNVIFKLGSASFKAGEELQLDETVAVRCSGNNEFIMGHEIMFPDSFVLQKTKFDDDCGLAFISDIHVGSHKFLEEEFERFIEWINGQDETAKKIKYLFIVGDTVDGIGVFPGQEALLKIKTLKGQYDALASHLKKVNSNITMFLCPGQHDASRVPEPQPILDKTYAEALYEIPNLVLVPNPCLVKLYEGNKEFKVQMYHGASIHTFINNIEELRLIKAHRFPAKAVKHMLKRRHFAPSHGISASIVYVPNAERDPLVISEVPDIMCTGEVHRLDIERYNGTLILTGNCWQSQTEFEEKVGNIPDPCKVPIFNVKTHELRIFDFNSVEEGEEKNQEGIK